MVVVGNGGLNSELDVGAVCVVLSWKVIDIGRIESW